jgi:hypothetical protein
VQCNPNPPPRRTPMDSCIGMDVHAMSCTVVHETGVMTRYAVSYPSRVGDTGRAGRRTRRAEVGTSRECETSRCRHRSSLGGPRSRWCMSLMQALTCCRRDSRSRPDQQERVLQAFEGHLATARNRLRPQGRPSRTTSCCRAHRLAPLLIMPNRRGSTWSRSGQGVRARAARRDQATCGLQQDFPLNEERSARR